MTNPLFRESQRANSHIVFFSPLSKNLLTHTSLVFAHRIAKQMKERKKRRRWTESESSEFQTNRVQQQTRIYLYFILWARSWLPMENDSPKYTRATFMPVFVCTLHSVFTRVWMTNRWNRQKSNTLCAQKQCAHIVFVDFFYYMMRTMDNRKITCVHRERGGKEQKKENEKKDGIKSEFSWCVSTMYICIIVCVYYLRGETHRLYRNLCLNKWKINRFNFNGMKCVDPISQWHILYLCAAAASSAVAAPTTAIRRDFKNIHRRICNGLPPIDCR